MEVGGLKCTPEELWAKHFFSDLLKKKILSKSGLHFRANYCMAELFIPPNPCLPLFGFAYAPPEVWVFFLLFTCLGKGVFLALVYGYFFLWTFLLHRRLSPDPVTKSHTLIFGGLLSLSYKK